MNENKVIRIGYLVLCVGLAVILPYLVEDKVPILTQFVFQVAFTSIGIIVYTLTEDSR